MHNTNTPAREAMVISPSTRMPIMDFDPIEIPVDADGFADPFDVRVTALIGGIEEFEAEMNTDVDLVWSDDQRAVRGMCPRCDREFILSDGAWVEAADGSGDVVVCPHCALG